MQSDVKKREREEDTSSLQRDERLIHIDVNSHHDIFITGSSLPRQFDAMYKEAQPSPELNSSG